MTDRHAQRTTAERLEHLERLTDEGHAPVTRRPSPGSASRGKGTARERIEALFDPGTFTELDRFVQHRNPNFGMLRNRPYGDGVITGHGLVNGRRVFAFSQDFTVFGGSLGEVFAEKVCKVMDMALRFGSPTRRHQRLRRRAHPGGRRLAGRLRRHLRAQRRRLGRDPADLARDGPLRRRRRLLARHHRLRADGARHLAHVHHRPRRREDRDRRGRVDGGARRRRRARRQVGRRARRLRLARPTASPRPARCSRTCPTTTSSRCRGTRRPTRVDREIPELDTLIPDSPTGPTT